MIREASAPPAPSIIYRIDASDTIVHVGDAWDAFALANEGNAILGGEVIGRSLWEFVSDLSTREIYRNAMKRIREGSSTRFAFRCDAPECRRTMELELLPLDAGGIEFRSHTVGLEMRPAQELLRSRRGPVALIRACGWCKRIDANGEWVEVEVAVQRLHLLEQRRLPALTHGICEPCAETLMATVART